MFSQAKPENAVAAIRVSTTKQGTEGDSPEAQKEQIERFAANRNIIIKKIFLFLESASKEQQPMQEAIDYCKNPKHGIQLFVVKSIDRFTRGGSYSYSNLKRQLEDHNVRLIDIYGIIGSHKINTLDHLGVSYKWSVYDPTKNSEILEAERASDEKRDIMSRMIGAEIRYTRLGYWNREAPLGFVNMHVETMHGKRTILEPHPVESQWIKKIFELRCRGNVSDREIVREVNKLGFRTRTRYRRDRANPMRIISKKGGQQLSMKSLWRYVRNPLYAGINNEVWLLGEPIKCKFNGLVSYDIFNRANRGKISISDLGGNIRISVMQRTIQRAMVPNPTYPYRRVVVCSVCRLPLFGSASRGRGGQRYPAYHCGKRKKLPHHYFRVTVKQLHEAVEDFTHQVSIERTRIAALLEAVLIEQQKRQAEKERDADTRKAQVKDLKIQAKLIVERIRFCAPETIKYLEEDLRQVEREISAMAAGLPGQEDKALDSDAVMLYARHFAVHPELLLFDQEDTAQKANYFGLLFQTPPSYHDIIERSVEGMLSPLFAVKKRR